MVSQGKPEVGPAKSAEEVLFTKLTYLVDEFWKAVFSKGLRIDRYLLLLYVRSIPFWTPVPSLSLGYCLRLKLPRRFLPSLPAELYSSYTL